MAGEAGKTGAEQSTEKSSIGFSLPFAERAPANPMEVMAAATAAGMALTTQFANAFFGMMQAAMETTGKPAESKAPQAPVVKVAETVKAETKPEPGVVRTAEPVETAKPATAAKPVEKPAVTAAKPKVATKPAPVAEAKPKATKPEKVAEAKPKATKIEKPAEVKPKAAKAETVAKGKTKAAKADTVAEAKPKTAPLVATPVAAAAKSAPRKKAAKAADDLKKISGIGPKLAEMLGGMGVTRFAEIAAWTDKDVAHVDRELGLDGRIAKDNWIAQAKALLR